MLEFRLEENVPLSPRDALFDYDIVEDDVDDNVFRISVAVYAQETILGYYEACRKAGLMPLSFEVEAQAIARASLRTGDMGTFMIVDFGKTRTGVGIVHKNSLMFTSTVDIGGEQLSDVLRRQVGVEDEDELTKIKNEFGILDTGERGIREALLSPVSALKEELKMRIDYWDTRSAHSENRRIEKIILCGGSVNLAGLPEYLTEVLGVDTQRAAVWQNAFSVDTYVPPVTRKYSYGYATAVGLALKDFVDTNVL
jgi:Tfp pilus assembly PilM family ATPase